MFFITCGRSHSPFSLIKLCAFTKDTHLLTDSVGKDRFIFDIFLLIIRKLFLSVIYEFTISMYCTYSRSWKIRYSVLCRLYNYVHIYVTVYKLEAYLLFYYHMEGFEIQHQWS